MIHELYRLLNSIVIYLAAIGLVALQTVVLKLPALMWLELDLILLVVVYLSLHRPFLEGLILVACLGRLAEIHSGNPAGLQLVCYLASYLAIFFIKEFFLVGTSFSSIILAVIGAFIWKIIFLILANRYGIFANVWRTSIEYLIPYLLAQGFFARFIFDAMKYLDHLTHTEPASRAKELSGEEF